MLHCRPMLNSANWKMTCLSSSKMCMMEKVIMMMMIMANQTIQVVLKWN
ncbi:hypothetical protein V6Z11_A08G081200 [Gossypium hirsutum]